MRHSMTLVSLAMCLCHQGRSKRRDTGAVGGHERKEAGKHHNQHVRYAWLRCGEGDTTPGRGSGGEALGKRARTSRAARRVTARRASKACFPGLRELYGCRYGVALHGVKRAGDDQPRFPSQGVSTGGSGPARRPWFGAICDLFMHPPVRSNVKYEIQHQVRVLEYMYVLNFLDM